MVGQLETGQEIHSAGAPTCPGNFCAHRRKHWCQGSLGFSRAGWAGPMPQGFALHVAIGFEGKLRSNFYCWHWMRKLLPVHQFPPYKKVKMVQFYLTKQHEGLSCHRGRNQVGTTSNEVEAQQNPHDNQCKNKVTRAWSHVKRVF